MKRTILQTAALAVLFLAGCGGPAEPTAPDTGARATAEAFYGALIANDPARAYDALDPDSRQRVSAGQFATLARAYTKSLVFPADKVHIHMSEEQGDAATVRVTLTGRSGGHTQRYSDGVTLRRKDGRWGVVLPANFGQKAH